jgi:pimeloyl-ACP methyl ester carboxylesterase
MARARTLASLVRWLGPWTPETRVPDVRIETVTVDGRFPARVYHPRGEVRGALAIAPGLHHDGPDDRRMDRFCRVLAASGILTMAPFLPDFVALRVTPAAIEDFTHAYDAFAAGRAAAPGLFSISFGSLLALRTAAVRDVGGVVVFGGYADWDATIRFTVTGELDGRSWVARDWRNLPVVFMNLLDDIGDAPAAAERAAVVEAWRRYVRATWGRNEMRAREAWEASARAHAAEVPPSARDFYLRGCGLAPGAADAIDAALARRGKIEFLDVRPYLARVRCPVWITHGVADDVIPWTQAESLARGFPPGARPPVLLTGLYGHTQLEGAGGARALARELAAMVRIVRAIEQAATSTRAGAPLQ